ncbi:hypothetical protein EV652_103657 [Kribbella steppae]|uniref:Uncharacterized protein n=1 Tax=Kribbella steppae TaxID=2512223 RepID=A0A4R2HUG3_9ACTN|nr:hypothetical protein [Kribbella steppae]TCO33655.1 hypothetical protein EV652_103657 [Kribbella steppae]
MNVPGKRLILGAAVAVAALGVGGVAYAAADDPAPEQGYVTIEDGATTPSPGNTQQQSGTRGDCPEKNGQGQGQGEGQGEAQPSQLQTQPSQPQTQPEQTQPDAAENA